MELPCHSRQMRQLINSVSLVSIIRAEPRHKHARQAAVGERPAETPSPTREGARRTCKAIIKRWERLDMVRAWAAITAFACFLTAVALQPAGIPAGH
jgi:hypothetical protein